MNPYPRWLKKVLFIVRKELNIFLVDVRKYEGGADETISQPLSVVSEVPRLSLNMIGCDWWVMRDLLSYELVLTGDHILESLSKQRVEGLRWKFLYVGMLDSTINPKESKSLDWVSLCYCSVKHVHVFSGLCTCLEYAQRLIEIYWDSHLRYVFPDRVLENLPHANLDFGIFKEWQHLPS